jgi:hypothetical protein
VNKWVKQYGRENILPKRVKVETMNEIQDRRIEGSPQEDTGTGGGAGLSVHGLLSGERVSGHSVWAAYD